MGSALTRGESPRKALRRIVRDQIDKARADLGGDREPAEAVHAIRKRLKRLRALLRLARDGMDRAAVDRENRRLRDAARPLSEARDAAVLVAAFEALVERSGDLGHPDAVAAVRSALGEREADASRRLLGDGSALDTLGDDLDRAREELGGPAFDGVRWPTLRDGLRRIYRAGRRAFRAALDAPTDEGLHEWRKRVKDLAHALAVVEPIRPGAIRRRADRAGDLADTLGDDHDLAVLRKTLLSEGMPAASAMAFLPAIDARRAEWRDTAFALGREVYRERPRELADRLDAAWRAWRSRVDAR